jgi:hypothetical protein
MNPANQAIVAQRTLEGFPTRAIAAEIGTSHTSVERARNNPKVKAWIEKEFTSLMERGLKPARKTLCRLAALGTIDQRDPDTGIRRFDKDLLKLSLDASKVIVSQAQGAPGTIINALIQINEAPQQSQELSGLAAFLSDRWSSKIQIEDAMTGIQASHTATTDAQVIDVEPDHDPDPEPVDNSVVNLP